MVLYSHRGVLGVPRLPNEFNGEIVFAILLVIVVSCISWIEWRWNRKQEIFCEIEWMNRLPLWAKGIAIGIICYMVILCGASAQSFIYLQF
jgi:hypothetical protein